MKKKITLRKLINPSIKVGDKVRMVDGSAFSYSGKQEESLFIVDSYPELTGLSAIIKDIDATVLAVNINNVATLSYNSSAYITDIKLSIGIGEFFTCSKFVEKVEEESKLTPDTFTLPKNWHVVVTEENQKEVSEWRGADVPVGHIAGIYGAAQSKEHNPKNGNNALFGTEITTEQFRKHVLREDIKTYPRIMEVSNFEDFYNYATRVVFMEKNGKYITWGGAKTLEEAEKTLNTSYWVYAREVAPIVELTVEDISAGKGVGVDPKLIRFKE